MNDEIYVEQSALKNFALFTDSKGMDLVPWTSPNADEFKIEPKHVGQYKNSDITFEYEPLTPEEYREEMSVEMDPSLDPGPEILNSTGTVANEAAGWYMQYSWAAGLGTVIAKGVDMATGNNHHQLGEWFKYYSARQPSVGELEVKTTDAPWTKVLVETWNTAVDYRCEEADSTKAELDFLTPKLVDAAAEYADVDFENEESLKDPNRQLGGLTPEAGKYLNPSSGEDTTYV